MGNYTVGPTAALQMNIDPSAMSDCSYCKIKKVGGEYPNVMECDGSWAPISCPAQSSVYLEDRSREGVTVCGEARAAPNGAIPADVLGTEYGFLDMSNQGADPERYQDICFGPHNAPSQVAEPGYGGFSNFAVAQCNNPGGCTVYRIFDTPPAPGARSADPCGHSWSPKSVLADKSQSENFEAVGVCKYKYAHDGSDGQQGGYVMKCTAPSGFAVAVGQTQSADCEASDGSNYTVGPTAALQMNLDPKALSNCSYCKIKKVDGAYPDVLDCDGQWMPYTCPDAASSVYLEDRSREGVTVCGEARAAPNGAIPADVLGTEYGFLDMSNQGEDPERYQDICFGPHNAPSQVAEPGYGGFSNFAVAQCNNPGGCTVYRIFDTPPAPGARSADPCGHSWSPRSVLADKSQ